MCNSKILHLILLRFLTRLQKIIQIYRVIPSWDLFYTDYKSYPVSGQTKTRYKLTTQSVFLFYLDVFSTLSVEIIKLDTNTY